MKAMNPRARKAHPARRRSGSQSGVAMFVVLALVVTVSAAGVFVARSASLEVRSSGYIRQAAQTHYVTEAGGNGVLVRMRTACAAFFTPHLRLRALQNGIPAAECPRITVSGSRTVTPPCYNFALSDLDLAVNVGTERTFERATGVGSSRTAGSFGVAWVNPQVLVRVTELGADASPQRGSDLSEPSLSTAPMRYLLEATGSTELESAAVGADTTNAARGTEQLRAITVLRCN